MPASVPVAMLALPIDRRVDVVGRTDVLVNDSGARAAHVVAVAVVYLGVDVVNALVTRPA